MKAKHPFILIAAAIALCGGIVLANSQSHRTYEFPGPVMSSVADPAEQPAVADPRECDVLNGVTTSCVFG